MKNFLVFILMLGLLGACTNEPSTTPTPISIIPSPSPLLVLTSTSSSSASIDPIHPTATEILPTPTPILYTVEQNDTLTDIARKFNIKLEELVSSNPSVGTQALMVGMVLVIPPLQISESLATPTPWPVSIQQTQCYHNLDGSLWCLALLKNEYAETLQNLSVVFSLLDSAGTVVSNQTAFAPLDLLPSGKSIAIGALFAAPVPDNFLSQTQILSASSLPSSNNQYPPIYLQNNLVQVDWSGLSARVSGQVVLDLKSDAADRVWILAVAYDKSGTVIGFRRWESKKPLAPADVLSFDFGVSSLGPEIDHIDLLVEAAR